MSFVVQTARRSRWIAACMLLGLTGCVSAGPIVATPYACADLLPQAWQTPVPGAPLPDDAANATVADWIVFGDRQTAQLDIANDRTAATVHIIRTCEDAHRRAIERARRPWYRRL